MPNSLTMLFLGTNPLGQMRCTASDEKAGLGCEAVTFWKIAIADSSADFFDESTPGDAAEPKNKLHVENADQADHTTVIRNANLQLDEEKVPQLPFLESSEDSVIATKDAQLLKLDADGPLEFLPKQSEDTGFVIETSATPNHIFAQGIARGPSESVPVTLATRGKAPASPEGIPIQSQVHFQAKKIPLDHEVHNSNRPERHQIDQALFSKYENASLSGSGSGADLNEMFLTPPLQSKSDQLAVNEGEDNHLNISARNHETHSLWLGRKTDHIEKNIDNVSNKSVISVFPLEGLIEKKVAAKEIPSPVDRSIQDQENLPQDLDQPKEAKAFVQACRSNEIASLRSHPQTFPNTRTLAASNLGGQLVVSTSVVEVTVTQNAENIDIAFQSHNTDSIDLLAKHQIDLRHTLKRAGVEDFSLSFDVWQDDRARDRPQQFQGLPGDQEAESIIGTVPFGCEQLVDDGLDIRV